MRFGLKVNAGSWGEAQRWAGVAEDVGFHGLWTGDNMRNPRDPSIGGTFRSRHWLRTVANRPCNVRRPVLGGR